MECYHLRKASFYGTVSVKKWIILWTLSVKECIMEWNTISQGTHQHHSMEQYQSRNALFYKTQSVKKCNILSLKYIHSSCYSIHSHMNLNKILSASNSNVITPYTFTCLVILSKFKTMRTSTFIGVVQTKKAQMWTIAIVDSAGIILHCYETIILQYSIWLLDIITRQCFSIIVYYGFSHHYKKIVYFKYWKYLVFSQNQTFFCQFTHFQ